jgi:ribosomal protein S12
VYSSPAGIRRKRSKSVAEEDYNLLKDDVFVLGVIELGMDLPEELEESAMRKLASVRRMLIGKANTLINKYVPKDTGQLREAMIRTIRGSYADSYRLVIFFGSQRRKTAKYMHIVNENYYKHKLAHHGNTRSHQPPYNILYDPQAKKGFIGIISKKLWKEMKNHVVKMRFRLKTEYERQPGKKATKEELHSWVRFKGQV